MNSLKIDGKGTTLKLKTEIYSEGLIRNLQNIIQNMVKRNL